MRSKFLQTVKDTFFSSLPLAVIIIVCLCVAPMNSSSDYLKIILGYLCVIFGQAMFLVGLETSILPIGRMVEGSVAKPKTILGITIDTEKEIVLTVVEREVAVKIMEEIKEKMGVGTAAHGLCFFLPVEMSTLTIHENPIEE